MLPSRSIQPIGMFSIAVVLLTISRAVLRYLFPPDFLQVIELLALAFGFVGILLTMYTFRRAGRTMFAAMLTLAIFGALFFAGFYLPWLYFKASLGPNPVFP